MSVHSSVSSIGPVTVQTASQMTIKAVTPRAISISPSASPTSATTPDDGLPTTYSEYHDWLVYSSKFKRGSEHSATPSGDTHQSLQAEQENLSFGGDSTAEHDERSTGKGDPSRTARTGIVRSELISKKRRGGWFDFRLYDAGGVLH